MHITPARDEHLGAVNGLIARSKAHWGWAPEYLAAALPLMEVTPDYLRRNLCFEIRAGEGLAGFLSLVEAPRPLLDNLWIEPERIGQGFGRFACAQAFDLAGLRGWAELATLPEPPAEGFYLRMGFRDTGERIASRVRGGPVFCVFRKAFAPPPGVETPTWRKTPGV
ncbi:MAG: GNAT family N-acetyltransferase [Caulobacteraceae bacterium]|nr:GNAT family N-acetyltransferase [Caulobacteraceae bacterium]